LPFETVDAILAERSLPFKTVDAISHDGLLRNGIDRFKWQRPFTKGKLAVAMALSD